jgi:hypothetical protein
MIIEKNVMIGVKNNTANPLNILPLYICPNPGMKKESVAATPGLFVFTVVIRKDSCKTSVRLLQY